MRRPTLAGGLLIAPSVALAHTSDRAIILTLPTRGFIWGAGVVVAVTALVAGLGVRLPQIEGRSLFSRPRLLPVGVTNWLATGLLFLLIVMGFAGTHDPDENPLPLMIWTVLWVGLTLVQAVVGNLWRDIDPWTGPVRAMRAGLGLQASAGLRRLGHWPAVVGYLGFAWFEIVSVAPADPQRLAMVVTVYWLLILVLATLEGEDWLAQGEFLTMFFALIARMAPVWARYAPRRVDVWAGLPGAQVPGLPPLDRSAIAFVTLALASVSFDGLHETFRWVAALGLNPLDYPGRSVVMFANTLGLLAMWAGMTVLILAATRLHLAGIAPGRTRGAAMGRMCLSFLPIAVGYHVAHYLTALLTQGQYGVAALSDPLGRGDDLLGLGPNWVGFGFLSKPDAVWAIWIAQFAIILGAHLVAVILADCIGRADGMRPTLVHQIPLSLLMVLYTCFGLWLLATPSIG